MVFYKKKIIINGHHWIDVTNETTSGMTYSIDHVIENNGEEPKTARNY